MNEAKNRTLTLKRTFDAPIKLVWKAWTQPEHVINWWGPKGMKIEVVEHDFRVGGKWKYVMPMPDGNELFQMANIWKLLSLKKLSLLLTSNQ